MCNFFITTAYTAWFSPSSKRKGEVGGCAWGEGGGVGVGGGGGGGAACMYAFAFLSVFFSLLRLNFSDQINNELCHKHKHASVNHH